MPDSEIAFPRETHHNGDVRSQLQLLALASSLSVSRRHHCHRHPVPKIRVKAALATAAVTGRAFLYKEKEVSSAAILKRSSCCAIKLSRTTRRRAQTANKDIRNLATQLFEQAEHAGMECTLGISLLSSCTPKGKTVMAWTDEH
eukprot:2065879-Amphidinium_carterae.2